MSSTQERIVVKSVFYRLFAFIFTVLVTYLNTGNVSKSLNLGFLIELLQTLLYYLNEVIWNNISWGRI